MTIKKMYVGQRGKQKRYYLTEEGESVAWYDTLGEAALVLRYLSGGNMTPEDQRQALQLMGWHHQGTTDVNRKMEPEMEPSERRTP